MRIKSNIFVVIIGILSIFSAIPIFILMNQSISSLDYSRELSAKTIDAAINDQTIQLYKSYAQNLAKRLTDFLEMCETDLHDLSSFPHQPLLYLEFSRNNSRRVNFLDKNKPLYKEIALINKSGHELIKIVDNKLLTNSQLRDVSDPQNTTYLSETYFLDTKNSLDDIYISHLTANYVSRYEQLEEGKTLEGVIRFCKKLKSKEGEFEGICVLSIDVIHLLDFVEFQLIPRDLFLTRYKTGSYTYLVDDEGWIIAHQKLWDIKGLDHEGKVVEPLTETTPEWKYDAGIIPINLLQMDWRLKDYETGEPMSSIIKRVRRGETVITTMKSMGIHKKVEGIVRTRSYAPIKYSTGNYSKHGIFGIVSVGTSLKKFIDASKELSQNLEEINESSKNRMALITILIFFTISAFSFIAARWISRPLRKLTNSLSKISKGDYSLIEIKSRISEVQILSRCVTKLANELKEKEKRIAHNVKDLELVNERLAKAEKELAAYWIHEYEDETDTILEEKIKLYEKKYPILKKLRSEECIGRSSAFLRTLRLVIPQGQMNIPTWLFGESGVGKSALAYVIHSLSPRVEKPFNVFGASEFAAADPTIVLGKLFGYGPGHGIIGINKNGQQGILELCNNGTLLIDDVESLPLDTQAQILRVVDGLDFHYAVGISKSISVDVRFLFASNANLEQKVKEGLFRKDLFRRIGGTFNKIEIPPLRERKQDIPLLAEYFVNKYCKKNMVQFSISNEAINLLLNHDFMEGNIAELKVLIELACENARIEGSKNLTVRHFPTISKRENKKYHKPIDGLFSDSEKEKLSVLRKNNFRISISEELLGFKKGSHALSHYLRGMSLKALFHSKWNWYLAVQVLVGSNENSSVAEILQKRMQGYQRNIELKIKANQESSLFTNLPKEYHEFLAAAIDKFYNK